MGSATTQALAASTAALGSTDGVDLGVARELFAAARSLGETSQLSGALADAAAAPAKREQVVSAVFGTYAPATVSLLKTVTAQRWASASDLVAGVEELAIRSASLAEPSVDVEGELFQLLRTIADNPELELALGSRLGDASAKGVLVEKLLAQGAGSATVLIASSLVQQPRGRRVRAVLTRALSLVAHQRGSTVATVYATAPLSDEQSSRLSALLSQRVGTAVSLNVVIDESVVGGIRVEVGDDVIDATVSSRLNDLRQKLAG